MHRYILCFPAVLILTACTAPTASKPLASPEKVTTVCALYERAYLQTKAALLPAPIDIVIGCPGRTSLKSQRSRAERVAAVRLATRADIPASVGDSDVGRRLFQRMISRGVPVSVATQMVRTREFAKALAARI